MRNVITKYKEKKSFWYILKIIVGWNLWNKSTLNDTVSKVINLTQFVTWNRNWVGSGEKQQILRKPSVLISFNISPQYPTFTEQNYVLKTQRNLKMFKFEFTILGKWRCLKILENLALALLFQTPVFFNQFMPDCKSNSVLWQKSHIFSSGPFSFQRVSGQGWCRQIGWGT